MTTTSFEYILNPIFFIIYFVSGDDFITKGKRNYAYFLLNIIISIIISFFSLIFNEFLILFFCNLDKDTHLEISNRSNKKENFFGLKDIENEEEDTDN